MIPKKKVELANPSSSKMIRELERQKDAEDRLATNRTASLKRIKPLTCRTSFMILFLESNLNRKDPMAFPSAESSWLAE